MADDVWKRLDQRIRAARDRADVSDEHGFRASRNIEELRRLRGALDGFIDAELVRGREQGASWDMLGTSKQQAQQRYKRIMAQKRRVNRH